jgi:hypothetical protein
MERPFDPWNCTLPKPPNDVRRLVANFETYKKAKAECDLRVDQLKQAGSNEARQLARDLVACAAGDGHCLSPACPLCVGRTRLWLTEQMLRLWPANVELELWTVIPAAYVAPPGGLNIQACVGSFAWVIWARNLLDHLPTSSADLYDPYSIGGETMQFNQRDIVVLDYECPEESGRRITRLQ